MFLKLPVLNLDPQGGGAGRGPLGGGYVMKGMSACPHKTDPREHPAPSARRGQREQPTLNQEVGPDQILTLP